MVQQWQSLGVGCFERPVHKNGVATRAILAYDSAGWHFLIGNMTFNFNHPALMTESASAKRKATLIAKAWDWELC